jgi:hypothetical protein
VFLVCHASSPQQFGVPSQDLGPLYSSFLRSGTILYDVSEKVDFVNTFRPTIRTQPFGAGICLRQRVVELHGKGGAQEQFAQTTKEPLAVPFNWPLH